MSMTYGELRAASDEELIQAHDQLAKSTGVGTGYYLAELNRRGSDRLDRSIKRLTMVNVALVVVGTVAVIFELLGLL